MDINRKVCALILCGLLVTTTAVPAVSGYAVYAGDRSDVVVDEDLTSGEDSTSTVTNRIADEGADTSIEKEVIDDEQKASVTSEDQKQDAVEDASEDGAGEQKSKAKTAGESKGTTKADPYNPNKPDFRDAEDLEVVSTGVNYVQLRWQVKLDGSMWPTGYNIFVDGVPVAKTYDWQDRTITINIPYNKTVQVYVCSYYQDSTGSTWWGEPTNTVTITGKKIGKAKISRVTKLSSGKVCIHVSKPSGATGVVVYKGSKKIKTLKGSGSFKYSAKNAGKSSYKVRAYINSGGKNYYSAYSKLKKPISNIETWPGSAKRSAKEYNYATAHFLVSKVYYSGGKLKVTGYLYNSRIFNLKGSKIDIKIYAEGKTISKRVKVKTNICNYGKKKITVSLGKKSVYDLRDSRWYTVCVENNWGYGWET